MTNKLSPESNWCPALRFKRSRKGAYYVNNALRDGVEIVIVRSASGRVQGLVGPERFELLRLQAALVVPVQTPDRRLRQHCPSFVDGGPYQRIEFRQHSLCDLYDL